MVGFTDSFHRRSVPNQFRVISLAFTPAVSSTTSQTGVCVQEGLGTTQGGLEGDK